MDLQETMQIYCIKTVVFLFFKVLVTVKPTILMRKICKILKSSSLLNKIVLFCETEAVKTI
jgi:hypothetical protein